MKPLLYVLLILSPIIVFSQNENIRVLRIKDGTISKQEGKKILRKGDRLSQRDVLTFSSPKAVGIVATKDRKIFLLKNATGKPTKTSEALVKYDKNKLSKGVADSIVSATILKDYFSKKPFIIDGDTLEVPLSPKVEKLNDSTFFYVQYDYKGKTYPVKLAHEGYRIIFAKQTMYSLSTGTVDQEDVSNFKLYVRYAKECKSLLIVEMDAPLFMDLE